MADVSPQLDYAQGPAWHRRTAVRRIVFAVVLLAVYHLVVRNRGPTA